MTELRIEDSLSKPFTPELLEARLEQHETLHPNAMTILDVGGVHPRRSASRKNPYLPGQPVDTEDFSNIGRHCLAVAYAAEQIAAALQSHGLLTQSGTDLIVQRALVHDANKALEVMRKKAVKQGVQLDPYSTSAYATIQPILAERGVPTDIVDYMETAGKETGHNSLKDFVRLVPETGEVVLHEDRSPAEMIVHLADDMTYSPLAGDPSTYFLTTSGRMDASDFKNRYPFLYKEGFGFKPDGSVQLIKDIGSSEQTAGLLSPKTYAEWQLDVAHRVSEHLKGLIEPTNPRDAELFMQDLVNQGLGDAA